MGDQRGDGAQREPTGEAAAPRWGDPITAERQAELQRRLDAWAAEVDHGERRGPFDAVWDSEPMRLTGADVYWLAERVRPNHHGVGSNLHLEGADLSGARLDGAHLSYAHLGGADLSRAHLTRAGLQRAELEHARLAEAQLAGANLNHARLPGAYLADALLAGADLQRAELTGAVLVGACLEDADLGYAHLERAKLGGARLERARLEGAYLKDADLSEAQLQDADLSSARLDGATLADARLEGANLPGAQLEGALLFRAHLERAELRATSFDKVSRLNLARLDGAALDQVIFDNTNLTVVEWGEVRQLGDERLAKESTRGLRVVAYRAAARAYRSLSVALRAQGIAAHAIRFHYRAELMDRYALLYDIGARLRSRRFYTAPFVFLRWLGSWGLGTFAGYGDYVGRLFLTYAVVVCAFAMAIFLAGQQALTPDHVRDALVLSVTSFHGRGLQPPGLPLTDAIATLAGAEAVFGLLIEGIFIAAFTRRVTGS